MRTVMLLFMVMLTSQASNAESDPPLKFGLTAVVVTENLRFLDRWSQYLEKETGQKVEFVLRKAYREVMDLLKSGDIDFGWICGYPFVQSRDPEFLQLMTIPVYRGKPLYYSYIIVPSDSSYKSFTDLRGRLFAFSDPDSNSGFLYPQSLLVKLGETSNSYFRLTLFTFNHAETVQAVAEKVVDGGAVDSYIWEYLAVFQPEMTKKTKIIKRSSSFGFPPLVSRLGANPNTVIKMKKVLENMHNNPDGRKLLSSLKLNRFSAFQPDIYNDIRKMANMVENSTSSSTAIFLND